MADTTDMPSDEAREFARTALADTQATADRYRREAEARGMDDDDRRLRAELDQMRRDGLITYDASADEWKITDKGRLALLEDREAFH